MYSKPCFTYKAFQLALFWSKLCKNSCFYINNILCKEGNSKNRTKIRSVHVYCNICTRGPQSLLCPMARRDRDPALLFHRRPSVLRHFWLNGIREESNTNIHTYIHIVFIERSAGTRTRIAEWLWTRHCNIPWFLDKSIS